MDYSKAPIVDIIDSDNIFINGDHINDIAERNDLIIHIANSPNSSIWNIRFMKSHGVMHNVDCPAHLTVNTLRGDHYVKRVSYIKYGLSHNESGPCEVIYNTMGNATEARYAINHKRINHSKYIKDPYNPTMEELFMMRLGEG